MILTEFRTSRRSQRHNTVSPFAKCSSNSECAEILPHRRSSLGVQLCLSSAPAIASRPSFNAATQHNQFICFVGWLASWSVGWFIVSVFVSDPRLVRSQCLSVSFAAVSKTHFTTLGTYDFRFPPCIIIISYFYNPTNALNYNSRRR